MNRVFITFDDGRKDNFANAFLTLKDASLKATFFVTTGFIDGTFVTNDFGEGRAPLSVQELQIMKDGGMEIGCHGDKHITEINDFDIAFQKLQNWGLISERCSFSLPNSLIDRKTFLEFSEKCSPRITNIRGGRDEGCYSFFKKSAFATLRLIETYHAYSYFNKPNILRGAEKRCPWPSLVIRKEDKLSLLCRFLSSMPKDSSIILMFHSIVEKPESTWEWSLSNFKGFCDFLDENKFKMQTALISSL